MKKSRKVLMQLALDALIIAEAGLADIGDADREPGDDLAWCEARAAQALKLPRDAITALRAAIAMPTESHELPDSQCRCEACVSQGNLLNPENMRMIVCATCGNKRCPHATNHLNICIGSNDIGQKGSSWGEVKPSGIKPVQLNEALEKEHFEHWCSNSSPKCPNFSIALDALGEYAAPQTMGAWLTWLHLKMTAIAQPREQLCVEQLSESTSTKWLPTEAAISALKRFSETCSDGEGCDVPKSTMSHLAEIGLIYKTFGASYSMTDFGRRILKAALAQPNQSAIASKSALTPEDIVAIAFTHTRQAYYPDLSGRIAFKHEQLQSFVCQIIAAQTE